ncbi:hypothetical protein R1T08_33150 [Streptomyces sp. SBC-4]|nr:hypothetical protein [Streptomyces sp. SBC-4]MDV5148868.1 hypothetical protein [Streptomyces sp. SBC-4]
MRHRPETDTDEPENPEKAEVGQGTSTTGEKDRGRRRIDLSVAQVSGSALAAVIAAKLASTLGVYGTIVGAGMISIIATCGGPLFQHLFKRTGEQVRDATAAAKPKARQVPFPTTRTAGDGDRQTMMLGTIARPGAYAVPGGEQADEEFGAATTHGTRVRGWKRPMIAAALVFGVTMGGITAYELVSGQDFSGTQGTTTFGSVVSRGGSSGQDAPDRDENPAPTPSGSAGDTGQREDGDGTPATGATPDPGDPGTGGTGTATPDPESTSEGSTDGGSTPTPTPTGPTTDPTDPTGPTEPTEPTAPTEPTDPAAPPTAPTEAPTTGAADPGTPSAPATGADG